MGCSDALSSTQENLARRLPRLDTRVGFCPSLPRFGTLPLSSLLPAAPASNHKMSEALNEVVAPAELPAASAVASKYHYLIFVSSSELARFHSCFAQCGVSHRWLVVHVSSSIYPPYKLFPPFETPLYGPNISLVPGVAEDKRADLNTAITNAAPGADFGASNKTMPHSDFKKMDRQKCGEQIIAEFLTEDDEFLRRVHQRLPSLFSDAGTAELSAEEIRSQLNNMPTQVDPSWLNIFLQATFFDPRWLYGDGFAFLHRGDTIMPADSHHNLIAMWTKACIHALGLAHDPTIGRLLPQGRARRFASLPLVETCFGPGIRKAGGPTAERMQFMSTSLQSAFSRLHRSSSPPQLVVVGGGFDAGSLRDHIPSGTTSFELDLSEVIEPKRRMLERYAAEFPDEAQRLPTLADIDLLHNVPSDTLPSLRRWNARTPTVFVIEAVLSYLPSERRGAVLHDVADLMSQCTSAMLVLWDELEDLGTAGAEDPVIYANEALSLLGLTAVTLVAPKRQFVMCLAEVKK